MDMQTVLPGIVRVTGNAMEHYVLTANVPEADKEIAQFVAELLIQHEELLVSMCAMFVNTDAGQNMKDQIADQIN